MSGWLLDTNVLSELRRPKPNQKVVDFVAAQPLDLLFISIVTFAEIRFGIEAIADPVRRAELNDWLTHKVRPMFEERVLPVSETSCSSGGCWSRMAGKPGTPTPNRI